MDSVKYYYLYRSPIGLIKLGSDGEFLTYLSFINNSDENLAKMNSNQAIFSAAIKWLDAYFKCEKPGFFPQYRLTNITAFTKEVLEEVIKIPYGSTMTYLQLAKIIGHKRKKEKMAAQAIGRALSSNPICLIIPCHRVVGQNQQLIGYSGGVTIKEKLLRIEKAIFTSCINR